MLRRFALWLCRRTRPRYTGLESDHRFLEHGIVTAHTQDEDHDYYAVEPCQH